jgi:hypothetical protein
MEQNMNIDINKIQMEASKRIAESLNNWGGVDSSKPTTGSSYLNGFTAQGINESKTEQEYTEKTKTSFSFGILNTISALKNSSFVELPAGRILLEKYEFLLVSKNISEAFVIEGFINELKGFVWESSVASALENMNMVFEKRRREIEVVKAYESIRNTSGRDLFSDATLQMKSWLISENRSTETLIHGLKRFGFNPQVRNLVSFLSLYENQNGSKFNIGYDNEVCEVTSIYSPVQILEKGSIFYSSGKFFFVNEDKTDLTEINSSEISLDFVNKSAILEDRDVKISNNKVSLNIGNNKVEFVYENDLKRVYFNNKKISENELPVLLSVTTNTLLENSSTKISKALFVSSASEEIADIDFGKKIKSKIYEGVEANIFRLGKKIYVQTVNPMMKLNKVYETNATQAVNIIKDFVKYDISESLTEFLEGEQAILSIMKNDKKEIAKNIQILENELNKIKYTKSQNPRISDSIELMELEEGIGNEITDLKNRWNMVNQEINKFTKNAKNVSADLNEEMGYSTDTEVRIKRNGQKGKIIGVDGNSKTYTVIFGEGKTGEYFFSEVENIENEVENVDITAPTLDLEIESDPNFNESSHTELAHAPDKKSATSKYDSDFMNSVKDHLAKAPGKSTSSPGKFIENEKNAGLVEAPKSGKSLKGGKGFVSQLASAPSKNTATGKKFVEDLENSNLADAPHSNLKGSAKFIEDLKNMDLAEGQSNSHVVKAPKVKTKNPKKFIEKESNANLEEAPGDHKKNGKEFVEDLERAGLASAPDTKKK